jgi:uncharacterized membrane protein YfhO
MKKLRSISNNPVVLYLLMATGLLTIIFFDFVFGNKYLLYKDIGNDTYFQIYAYLKDFNHILHQEHRILQWSFAAGIGQEIPPMYLSSIFQWPLLFINEEYIASGLAITEIFKILTIGLFFLLFLLNNDIDKKLSIGAALMVMLSGYVLTNTSYYLYWTNSALFFVGGLYAIDKLIKGNINWYVLFAVLVLFDQPAYFHFFSILSIYFLVSFGNKLDKNTLTKYALATISAILIAAPAWVANVRVMMESTRASEQFSYSANFTNLQNFLVTDFAETKTNILKFFGLHFEGFSNFAKSSAIFQETPLYFIGFFILPLFIYIIFVSFRKGQVLKGLFLSTVLLISFIPVLRISLWLFTGNYNRVLSFVIALIMLCECIFFLNDFLKSKNSFQTSTLSILFIAFILPFILWYDKDNGILYAKIILLLLTASIFIYFSKNVKDLIYFLLLIAIVDQAFEGYLVLNNRIIVSSDDFKEGADFKDKSLEASRWIDKNDTGIYRIEKDFNSGKGLKVSSVNDAMIQHFNGLKVYTSFNNLNYINYLQKFAGVSFENEFETRWMNGFSGNFDILNDLSVKYVISDGSFDWTKLQYIPVYKKGNIQVLRNLYFKDFGRINNSVISKSKFEALKKEKQQNVRNTFMVLDDLDLAKITASEDIQLKDTTLFNTAFKISTFNNHQIEGNITVSEFSMFYLPIIKSKVWEIIVNDKPMESYEANYGLTVFPLLPGDNHINIRYKTPHSYLLFILFLLGIVLMLFSRRMKIHSNPKT